MREFLLKLKAGTEELNYGRDILANYALEIAAHAQKAAGFILCTKFKGSPAG